MAIDQINSDEQLEQPVSTGDLQEKRAIDTRFKPGQSGNPKGRKQGSKNKINQAYLKAITADFDKHGKSVIERVREENPEAYLRLVAQLIPKDLDIQHSGNINVTIVEYQDDDKFKSVLIEGAAVDADSGESVAH